MSTVNAGWRGPNIVKDGLVFYLDAASGTSYTTYADSNTWRDISGNNNNGTLINGPVYNAIGVDNISFDGSDDYVSTTTNLGSNPLPAHSFSVWFRTSSASGKKMIGIENSQLGQGSLNFDRHIYVGTNGKLYYGVYDTAGRFVTSSLAVTNNAWTHATGVATGTNVIRLYMNGILDTTGTGNGFGGYASSYLRIGSYALGGIDWPNSSSGYFVGNIAIVQIYNRVLSDSEVLQNYNATRARFGL